MLIVHRLRPTLTSAAEPLASTCLIFASVCTAFFGSVVIGRAHRHAGGRAGQMRAHVGSPCLSRSEVLISPESGRLVYLHGQLSLGMRGFNIAGCRTCGRTDEDGPHLWLQRRSEVDSFSLSSVASVSQGGVKQPCRPRIALVIEPSCHSQTR